MWQVGLATRIYDAQYGSGHKRGHMYVRRLARLSWMHRYILLYTTAGNIYNYTSNFNGQLDIPWEDKIDYCHFRVVQMAWWRHQMELFLRLTCPLCRECNGHRRIAHTKASGAVLWCFYLRLNKRLCKDSRRRWFETTSCSLWRHCDVQETSLKLI